MINRDLTIQLLNDLQGEVHKNARNKEFWFGLNFMTMDEVLPNKLAEIGDEVAEARRAHRNSEPNEDIAEELCDVIIRALDCMAALEVNAGEMLLEKHSHNLQRPPLHGRKY